MRELQNVPAALTVRSPKRGEVPPEALPAAAELGVTLQGLTKLMTRLGIGAE